MQGSSPEARPGGGGARLPALDGLRGIAIGLVVAYHYLDIGSPSALVTALRRVSSIGWCGVDLFFVLSGFLITGILLDTRESPRYFQSFYARRCLRIFPVYYLTLAVVFVVGPWLGLRVSQAAVGSGSLWLWTYLSNWWMGLENAWAPAGLAVFWSLAIEEQFYLVWAPLVRAVAPRVLWRAALALVALPLLLRVGLLLAGAANPIAIHVFSVTRVDVLAVGACIAFLVRVRPDPAWQAEAGRRALVAGGLIAAAGFVAQGSTRWSGWGVQSFGLTAIAVAFGGLLLLALARPAPSPLGRLLTSRGLLFLGKYSYAIYVFHALVHHELTARLGARPDTLRALLRAGIPPWAVLVAAALAVTLGLAVASWYLVEKHCLAQKRYFRA